MSNDVDIFNRTQAEKDQFADDLRNLLKSRGWKLMVQILEANVAYIDDQIINKVEKDTDRKLTEEELDNLRNMRTLQKEVIDKPTQLINQLQSEEKQNEEYDPYYQEGESS